MIGAILDVVAAAAKAFDTIESNMNRPDMIKAEIQKIRQKYRDTVDAAQAVLADPASSASAKDHAFQFIQRIES